MISRQTPTNEFTIGRQMKNKNSANKDKVAIVTGSATGIGYETAIHLAKNGFCTYASMRNLPESK